MSRFVLVLITAWLGWTAAAPAAELLMFRRAGCPWCAAWDRQIAPAYDKTEAGRRAPVRFVDMDRNENPAVTLRQPVRYSPTFVLVDSGREVGRIEGYPGEDFFWGLLEPMIARLPASAPFSSLPHSVAAIDATAEAIR